MISARTRHIGLSVMLCRLVLPGPSSASAQDRMVNGRIEARQLTQSLEREIQTIGLRGQTVWIGYRLPSIPIARPSCNSPVLLEPATEMIVLVRMSRGAVDRVQRFTPNCEIDAGQMPVVWLDGVTAEGSAAWLTATIRTFSINAPQDGPVFQSALSILAVTPGPLALRSLVALARDDSHQDVRNRALSALAQRADQEAVKAIQESITNDPELEVKRRAVFALSQLPGNEGVPLLIDVARNNKNAILRREAMSRLGQSKDARAIAFFEEVLAK